jgi:glycosyltransferase involved in cell wall biosynthesis
MKILIINKEDNNGGAARAAMAWHQMLLKHSIDSVFAVERKHTTLSSVVATKSKLHKLLNQIRPSIAEFYLNWRYPYRKKFPWGVNFLPTGFLKLINSAKPDLVNMHWISHETISWSEIEKIQQPIIWTMHDMWAMTGGCHYTYGCEKYLSECGTCPQLKSNCNSDLSRKIFNRKKALLEKKNITVIASSQWLYDCFKKSALFKDLQIYKVPNPIDVKVFKPADKEAARNILNLPLNKKLILFMAFAATTDERKGFQFIPSAIEELQKDYNVDQLEIIVVGDSENKSNSRAFFPMRFLGSVKDDWSLALIYSACDVFVAPSMQENLSNAVMESLACATPVVAFNIGGMPEMIEHKFNGYLATPFMPSDIAKGINYVFANEELKKNARDYVLKNFNSEIVYEKLKPIYSQVLGNK